MGLGRILGGALTGAATGMAFGNPWAGAAIGAAGGYMGGEEEAAQRKRETELAARTQELSPWTGLQAQPISKKSSEFGHLLRGGMAGAGMMQSQKNLEMQQKQQADMSNLVKSQTEANRALAASYRQPASSWGPSNISAAAGPMSSMPQAPAQPSGTEQLLAGNLQGIQSNYSAPQQVWTGNTMRTVAPQAAPNYAAMQSKMLPSQMMSMPQRPQPPISPWGDPSSMVARNY